MISLPVVLLAGGLGTRVSSISGHKPKALLPLAGKPFIDWKLTELAAQGITKVYLLLGYGSKAIEQHLSEHSYGLDISIIQDKPNCRGTAQALFDSIDLIDEDQFILTYGDNLLPIPISNFTMPLDERHCRMVTTTNIGPADKPNATAHEGWVVAYGKDNPTKYTELDYGYSVLSKKCLGLYLAENAADLAPVFSLMAKEGVLEAHTTDYPYTEIGTPSTYFQADEKLRNNFQ